MQCKQHILGLRTMLRQNNLKATPARLGLLDVFEHIKKPISVDDLARKLRGSNVDTATLYRNVDSLESLGVLKKIRFNDRKSYYELETGKHHHHLICSKCGRIEDVL